MQRHVEPRGRDLTARKIVRLFEKLECPPIAVMRTDMEPNYYPRGGPDDDGPPPYAVIHDNNLDQKRAHGRVMAWQKRHHTNILKFDASSCASGIDALMCELEDRSGYRVVWKRNELS